MMIGISEHEMRAILDGAIRNAETGIEAAALQQSFVDATIKLILKNNVAIEKQIKSQSKQRFSYERDDQDWD